MASGVIKLPTNTYGNQITLTAGAEYTAPSDGYLIAQHSTSGSIASILINGVTAINQQATSSTWAVVSLYMRCGQKATPYGGHAFFIPFA